MKFYAALIIPLLTACAGTAPMPPAEPGVMQLQSQEALTPYIGRRLTRDNGDYVVMAADGTFAGVYSQTVTTGSYVMRDGFFCRVVTAGPSGPAPEDCQVVTVSDDKVTFVRERGTGAAVVYTMT